MSIKLHGRPSAKAGVKNCQIIFINNNNNNNNNNNDNNNNTLYMVPKDLEMGLEEMEISRISTWTLLGN